MQSEIEKEIEQWAPQMGEHALFLHLLLHEPLLKQKGLELFHKWQLYVCQQGPHNLETALRLIDELEQYKSEILNRLLAGEWLGAVYPQFVDHIRRELIYFSNKIQGVKLSPEDEVKFWNTINSEHAGFASHLLDPTEEELVDKADDTMKKIRKLSTSGDMASIVMAIEAGADLTAFNIESYNGTLSAHVRSIIHPTLLKHVIREGQIGNNILAKSVGYPKVTLVKPDICDTKM